MTDVKIEGKVGGQAAAAIEPHAKALYDRPGCRILAIVELAHTERTQPAPDSDKNASVKMRISGMEIPEKQQEHHIRDAMRALYLHRTAQGTLEADGEIELSDNTVKLTAGMLNSVELARLRTGLLHYRAAARRAVSVPNLSTTELSRELREIADGLDALLERTPVE